DTGAYPVSKDWQGYASNWGASLGENWLPELVGKYLTKNPCEPTHSDDSKGPQYLYRSDGKDYKLIAHVTGDCSPAIEQDGAAYGVRIDPARIGPTSCWAYGYWTPDAAKF